MPMQFFVFDSYQLLGTFLLILAIQMACFAFAAAFKTDKLTDISYGLTFALLALLFIGLHPEMAIRSLLLNLAVILWGVRLATYLFIRILKIKHDKRFDGRRENFWAFLNFWLLQAVAIWIILLPATIVTAQSNQPNLSYLDYTGLAIFLFGFLYESIADQQKFRFRNQEQNKGEFMQSGLWRFSRYPNYFGEILVWWGLFILAASSLTGWQWIAVLSPLFITLLLLKVSGIPLLEKSSAERYGDDPAYQAYKNGTNLLIPGFQKRSP